MKTCITPSIFIPVFNEQYQRLTDPVEQSGFNLEHLLEFPPLSLIAAISKPGYKMAETPVRSGLAPAGSA